MTSRTDPNSAADARALSARSTARGVTATWWYTLAGVVFFELMVVFIWLLTFLQADLPSAALVAQLVGGLIWVVSTVPLLLAYRHRTGESTSLPWRRILTPLLVAVAYGVLAFALSGLWLMLLLPVAQSLQLLDWPRAVRVRLLLAATALLLGLWVVDVNVGLIEPPFDAAGDDVLFGFFSTALPLMTVLSLWWWDVLIALDRARVSEARLAATQERLSVATDVHDLQGHHLQVIALQLELAERLLRGDADAALEQLRAARVSVDEARQGTRDLATRFRSVPLRDELANARDLLRAAGIAAEAVIPAEADDAPAAVFGPVIRETTTNVLRHGGGRQARLTLGRSGGVWRYEIRNDVAPGRTGQSPHDGEGSGLQGIGRRAAEAGGSLEVLRGEHEFTVIVCAPAPAAAAAPAAGEGPR